MARTPRETCRECGRVVTENTDGDWVDEHGEVMCPASNGVAYHQTDSD